MNKEKYSIPLDLKNVKITDVFWGREQELVRTEVIPYQWEALNDRIPDAAPSYCMRNFKIAGRLMKQKKEQGAGFVAPAYTFRGFETLPEDPENPDPDKFYGFVFQDSDFAKWIEAVGYSLMNHPDLKLEQIADEAIDIVCAAQAENGYLDTYYIINGMDRIFTNLGSHHELYCFGHLLEGAISYYQATGKEKLLNAAKRYADFICSKFGPEEGKSKGYPGHEIAEMALARLYELTGEGKYLELGRFFLDMRGRRPYYFDAEEKELAAYEGRAYKEPGKEMRHQYNQAHLPVREQSEAVGHAVRAVYLYSGMADVARLTGDEPMFAACERLWDSITKEKLYITGGIGGTPAGEAFSFPYDLPNDTAYSETCAAIGLAFFARRMLEIQADSRYGDCMEQALYNTVLAGMALDGKSFFYVNPLEVFPEACRKDARKSHVMPVRQKWFGCACCPPNLARIVSSLGAYAYTKSEDTLYTHLYVGSEISVNISGSCLDLKLESRFPWEGEVKVSIHTEDAAPHGTLAFRIPGWCKRTEVNAPGNLRLTVVNSVLKEIGKPTRQIFSRIEKGYLYLTGDWEDGDEIQLDFSMEVRCISANTNVRETVGKVAFTRGPICYCMEEIDNGKNLPLLRVNWEKLVQADKKSSCQNRESGSVSLAKATMKESGNVSLIEHTVEESGNTTLTGATVETSTELGHEMRVLKIPGLRQPASESGADLYRDYTPASETAVTLTFVPYYAWNNRGEGEMSVWVRI